jgi:hypothetical protein
MPQIAYNGQLYDITQAQYDAYTIGSPLPTGAVLANAGAVASGGTVTKTNTVDETILTQNTTNNTPGQTLTTSYQQAATSSAGVSASSTAGLTTEQLIALGGADPTDPYIRARLGLPALSDVQTLSGAIGNVNFANVGNAVSNLVTSFGNTISNISLGDIGNAASNAASSFGNSISNIGDLFSGSTATTVADTAVNTINTTTIDQLASGQITADQAAAALAESQVANTESTTVSTDTADAGSGTTVGQIATDNLPANADSTIVSTSTADAGSGTTVGTDTTAVPASAVDTAPAAVDYNAGLAGTDTTVSDSQVDTAPADVSSEIDPQASLAPGETIVSADAIAQDPGTYSADQLNAIADAQGVAGEEGNITADTLARDPGSFSADELNAIADAQGVAGDEGTGVSESDVNTDAATTTDPYEVQDQENGANAGTGTTNTGTGTSADGAAAGANIQGLVKSAQQQQTIADQRKQINNGDWRVRLRLAPQSNYLYNAPKPGILQPLKVTDGIIFPYTPTIDTSYRANYETYDLTHSNYRGYFYKNSYVDAITLKAQFTAQDTNDANYLLAVITFLKSVTKMFYGQDTQRGAPPPLVYLSGLGDYQFREHACVVSSFVYNLPDNVDYIRAGSPNNAGLNFNNIRDRQSVATNSIFGSINRLAAAFLTKGAETGAVPPPTLGLNRPTYVPTKMDINLTLLPIQSRQQVSTQFSVKEFANGNLIKGGFW